MGLFATIADALGLRRQLVVAPPGPLELTDAGRARLDGRRLVVGLAPADGGLVVQVEETEGDGLDVADADRERMRGLKLDWHDDRWRVVMHLDVRARETPNPDGRLYETSRPLVVGRALYFTAVPAPPLPRALLGVPGVTSVLLRENTVTVVREPAASWNAIDAGVDGALRQYFLMCGQALTPDDAPRREDPLEARVARILADRVLPGVHRDGGDIELVDVVDGVVRVHMRGACATCPASMLTLKAGVERALRDELPGEIREVLPV